VVILSNLEPKKFGIWCLDRVGSSWPSFMKMFLCGEIEIK
jgi:hypothetical protein